MNTEDLHAFARAWDEAPDGWTGRRHADAFIHSGRLDDAAAVCKTMWELGYPAGLTDLAWLERNRGNHDLAIEVLHQALPELDDEDRPLSEGVLGHWLWYLNNDLSAEAHLRRGLRAYDSARADLASLLRATDRFEEARRLLEEGVEAGEVDSMLPLANIFDEEGETVEAEQLYRRAYALGDAHSAWNLALLLKDQNRDEEAAEWRWKAAQGGDELAIAHLARDTDTDTDTDVD